MRILVAAFSHIFSEVIGPNGSFTDSRGLTRDTFSIKIELESEKFNFIVLGDWGGLPPPTYTSDLQLNGAKALMEYAKINPPEYVISIGDHFYYNGVETVRDRAWERTFENVYDSQEMMVPWYPTMGNHDWLKLPEGTEGGQKGNGWAQIEYSAHGSGRWTHPDLFFTTEYTTSAGVKVKTILVDTPTLTGEYRDGAPRPLHSDENCEDPYNLDCELRALHPLDVDVAEWAWEWLDQELAKSVDADFLFVTGHYMILDTGGIYDWELFRRMEPLMEQYKVSAFFQGHKHTQEHAVRSPKLVPAGAEESPGTVHFFTTGAGSLYDTESTIFQQLTGGLPGRSGCHPRFEENGNDNSRSVCNYYWATTKKDGDADSGFTSVNVDAERARVRFVTSEKINEDDEFTVGYEFDINPRNV
ncbi:unnamed protein product [Oikopleura dioica]|uniref:Calcineurin-like phosphoesterase domain-containing protein n=1 Tax=Oikopleura dioica TaxID=34765 RepID=E4XNY1_OIKDI|nr:unnamed protein product [Oikopleura dioica]